MDGLPAIKPLTSLAITRQDYEQMLAHLRSVYPQEGCGLLAGHGNCVSGVHPVDNILRSPVAYEMEPRQQVETMLAIEASGLDIVAIFHSHPHGPQAPSETDVARAFYPDVRQVIVSLKDPGQPVARVFWVTENGVSPISLEIV